MVLKARGPVPSWHPGPLTRPERRGLRALGEHRLIAPLRSEGGHRRYSRYNSIG